MNVLLVDDHAIVRRGLQELLSAELPGATFYEAGTGEDAVALAEEHRFDLVVLDVSMPRRGGLDALRDLRARWPRLPVIVLSAHGEEQYALRALQDGARAYLTKDVAAEELARAVHKVLDGGRYLTQAVAERLAESVGVDRTRPPHEALSNREMQILRLLAAGRSVKDIAAQLALSEKTISTYRTRVLEKMSLKSNAELMRYALRAGLVE